MNYKKEIENIWKVLRNDLTEEQILFRICDHNYKKIKDGNLIRYKCQKYKTKYCDYAKLLENKLKS